MNTTGITQNQSQINLQNSKESESIHYIGHGKLEKSPSSTSVIHVISHELDHIAEFKSKAIRDHAEIRSLDMEIDYEFRDGKIIAVGGKTTIVTEKIPEETSKKPIPALRDNLFDIKSLEKTDIPIDELTIQKSKLKEKLEQIETELDMSLRKVTYSNPDFKSSADLKSDAKEIELRETKSRIAVQLDELRDKDFMEKSRTLLVKIVKLQNNFRDSLVKLGLMQGKGNSLDTLA